MSSALDEDTQRALAEGRETAGAMLRAAQKDLQKVFIVFLVGFMGTFYALRLYIWDFFKGVTKAQMQELTQQKVVIIAQTPFDVILLQAKIALVAGIIVAIPPFLYFSRDALKARDVWPQAPVPVWKLAAILLLSAFLFVLGMAYGYFVFFPFMFAFLANNALSAGFQPTWSIVMWAQFIFLLTMSFGLAAQMPLAVTGLSYTGIVPYEFFRDKWRYAVVLIFVFGALFSPPDPFTQIMWAVPLLFLYGLSLYLAKVVVTAKRGSARLDMTAVARTNWNVLAGLFVLGLGGTYAFYLRGGQRAINDLLRWMGSKYRAPPVENLTALSAEANVLLVGVVVGVALLVTGLMVISYREIEDVVGPEGTPGDPTAIDLSVLDAAGVRAAPVEAFAELSEEEALERAQTAMDAGDHEKAQAILDRFDEAEEWQAEREAEAEAVEQAGEATPTAAEQGAEAGTAPGTVSDRAQRAGGTFLEEFTEGEQAEEDIGGYYNDIRFILDSLTSKAFHIVGLFMLVLASVFGWLYTGGIGRVYAQFLSQVPGEVTPDTATVIALHPVEALIFEVKFSTLIAAIVTLPVVAFYAWPALRERGFVRGRRHLIFGWAAALVAGLLGGFAVGYLYVAPNIISYLVYDALRANMTISYRITDFFWLIFFTTAGIGILADVPIVLLLLNHAGVPYRALRNRWREVTIGIMLFAALFTPADVITMFLVTVPLMAAYGVGIGVLFVVTLGGRRNLGKPREDMLPESVTE